MKKIITGILVVFLVMSSIGVIATNYEKNEGIETNTTTKSITFSPLTIERTDEEYLELKMKDVSSYLMKPDKPILPKRVEVIELPFEAKNIKVEVELGEITEKKIANEIKPCPRMLPLVSTSQKVSTNQIKDKNIYQSSKPYPEVDYDFKVYCGLNDENEIKKQVVVNIYPVGYNPAEETIHVAKIGDMDVTYEFDDDYLFSDNTATQYDLVIITPKRFEKYLQPLKKHKNEDVGIDTFIKTTEEIYDKYSGIDKPEKIKYFIKDAIEEWNIKYVLLVGGLKSQIHAKPRDGPNKGVSGWYLPVRYTNLYDKPKYPLESTGLHDPGVISDLYYADIYDGENKFSSWDPNNDDIFAAWGHPDYPHVKNDTGIDMFPDVCVGRLACRNIREVKTVVNKIINYESNPNDKWFKKMTVVSGDGFLDQQDLNIKWDTTGLKNGHYTIYAQSFNDQGEKGPVDTIPVQIDRTKKTSITFNHDDHLNPAIKDLIYPAEPIAEIVTISPGDILGRNDYTYKPNEREAYCNNFNPWANISYIDGVLTIRGKSYDPQPYGNVTDIHVWIKDSTYGETIFSEWRNNTEMYYEGEWVTGEKKLLGRGGALYYMDGFDSDIVWTSNGKLTSQKDVINAINDGCGFLFMSGHGSPNVWADHYPGVPGSRVHGSITGLEMSSVSILPPFVGSPPFPIDSLSNKEELPVTVIGGCHNSQFNVSMLLGLYGGLPYIFNRLPILKNINLPDKHMWCYGSTVFECFSWRLVRNPKGGAIATIGNTGLGYGMPGKVLTTGGGDGWISIEFFRQYGEHNQTVLGQAHTQAILSYLTNFEDSLDDIGSGHIKTVQQWALLGDPSLKIGGNI